MFNLTMDSTVDWTWLTQYLLNASAGPNGNVTVSNGWYDSGDSVMVTATPNGGYAFMSWSGNVPPANTNDNPVWLTMDQARALTANFGPEYGSVTVTIAPAGAVAAGAQWRMTTGPDTGWHNSGDVISGAPVAGSPYTIACSTIAGWTAPQNATGVVVTTGATTSLTREYRAGSMVLIPGGTFVMGIYGGQGGATTVVSSFYMDAREVTVGEFQAFCAATSYPMPPAPPWGWANTNLPMVNISWNAASAYASWRGKRLPSEAEYEYAMRNGALNNYYPWGNSIGAGNANYNNNIGQPTAVGSYPVSAYGLYDIAGNAWEWCDDWYGSYKTIRGGSYINTSWNLQCAPRFYTEAAVQYIDVGFRCASTIGSGGGLTLTDDVNGNGVPDWWEQLYFGLTGFDPNRDSDSDGMPDAQEYFAGTDPTITESVLAIQNVQPASSGNGLTLKWVSAPGKTYMIERCVDLTAGFSVLISNITATAPVNSQTDNTATNSGPYYYRIKLQN
jgi:formylglycine-generating enzyme required for sulfatase activity